MYNGRRSLPSATFFLLVPPPRSTLFTPRPAALRWNPLSARQAPRSLIWARFRGRRRPPPPTYQVARSICQYRAGLIPKPSKGRVFAGAGIFRRPSTYVQSPIPRSIFLYPASHPYAAIRKSWARALKSRRAQTSFVSVHLLSSRILSWPPILSTVPETPYAASHKSRARFRKLPRGPVSTVVGVFHFPFPAFGI